MAFGAKMEARGEIGAERAINASTAILMAPAPTPN